MMSISTTLDVGVLWIMLDRLPAVRRADDLHLLVLEQRREREDVARVVVDDEHLAAAAGRRSTRGAGRASSLLGSGRSATTRWRKSAVSSNSRSGDCTSLRTTLLATVLQPRLLVAGQLLAGEHDDRDVAQRRLGLDALEQLEAASCPAAARSTTQQSNGPSRSASIASAPVPTAVDLDVVVAEQLDDALPLDVVVLDDEQPLHVRRDVGS